MEKSTRERGLCPLCAAGRTVMRCGEWVDECRATPAEGAGVLAAAGRAYGHTIADHHELLLAIRDVGARFDLETRRDGSVVGPSWRLHDALGSASRALDGPVPHSGHGFVPGWWYRDWLECLAAAEGQLTGVLFYERMGVAETSS